MLSLFMVLGLITPAVNVAAETAAVKYTKVAVENPVANSWHNSGTDGGPDYAFNGNTGNWWHTNYGSTSTETNIVVTSLTNGQVNEIPAFAEIVSTRAWIGGEFDNPVDLGKFIYRSRTNTTTNWIQQWALYTANVTTDEPADTDFSLVQTGTFTSSAEQEVVLTTPVTATHFRLVAFSFNGGQATASKLEMYSVSEANTENVRLRVGQTVTYKQDGGVEVSAPNPEALNGIVTCEVVAGERIEYPYSTAKLATAAANFNGEEVKLEDCLFKFEYSSDSGTGKIYYIYNEKEGRDPIYLGHNNDVAGKPCVARRTNTFVGFNEEKMFYFTGAGNHLLFHKISGASTYLLFNKQGSADNTNNCTYFDLFIPSEEAPADSEIAGYKKLNGLNEITNGQKCLIASRADDGNYYVLYPVVNAEKYNYVAKVITYKSTAVPGVQIASEQEPKKITDCLFTFNATGTNRYNITALAGDTAVYLNHKEAGSKIPTTTNSNAVIEVVIGTGDHSDEFTFMDTASGNAGKYLQFYRGGNNGIFQFDRQNSSPKIYST